MMTFTEWLATGLLGGVEGLTEREKVIARLAWNQGTIEANRMHIDAMQQIIDNSPCAPS
jgi:hypothetical protein